jgi:hypothetical protein
MNVISPRLRRAALLGVLLLPASLPAGGLAAVGGASGGYGPPGPSAGRGHDGAPRPVGRGRRLVLQVRGSG